MGPAAGPAIPSRMTFPANFPAGFTSYERVPGEGGAIAERYANAVALAAARANRPLPDGSVMVSVASTAPPPTARISARATTAPSGLAAMRTRSDRWATRRASSWLLPHPSGEIASMNTAGPADWG